MPVTEHAVQLFQVVQSCFGRCQHVTAVIAEGILGQVKVRACGGHELPHACSFGARDCLRVERTFNVGQQCQFCGHVALFQLFHDVIEVFAGARGHAVDVIGAAAIPLLLGIDQFVL